MILTGQKAEGLLLLKFGPQLEGRCVMIRSLTMLGETERLFLRVPEEREFESILILWSDPLVMRYTGASEDRDVITDYFQRYITDPEAFVREQGARWWSIVELSSGSFVGLCSLSEKEIGGQIETDLGYFFLPAYWGRGYAGEAVGLIFEYAFTDVQVESVVAVIDPDNVASKSVASKLGMQFEGEVKNSAGETRQVYRLRRSEWNRVGA